MFHLKPLNYILRAFLTLMDQDFNQSPSSLVAGSMGGEIFLLISFLFVIYFLKCYFYNFIFLYYYR